VVERGRQKDGKRTGEWLNKGSKRQRSGSRAATREQHIARRHRATIDEQEDSRQQTSDSRQQTTDNRQQTSDIRQQTADIRQQTADSKQQTADSRLTTARLHASGRERDRHFCVGSPVSSINSGAKE
jgi:hypothetical protein